jgi:cytochrome c-type biogenesis protein
VIDAPLALGFTAGLFAVLNPCGFAMLPAYLSSFLVGDASGTIDDTRASVRRALVVGLSVSAGFAALFAIIGFIVRSVTSRVLEYSPWLTIAIGVALVGLGGSMLAGRELKLRIPRLDRGGKTGTASSMALYGVSYGVVSLGCTLPTFLSYVAGTLTRTSLASGAAVFGAYALGFTTLLTALTVAIALARRSLLTTMRRVLPVMNRASGALLVLAGLYVTYYGWYELHRLGESDAIVDRVTGLSFDIQLLVEGIGATRLGGVLAFVLLNALVWSLWRGRGESGRELTKSS